MKFKNWNRKKSVQLQRINGHYFLNFIYEKEDAKKKRNVKKIGIDLGYHKLIADSDGKFYGKELIDVYKKLAKKKRGSKKYLWIYYPQNCLFGIDSVRNRSEMIRKTIRV